MSIFFLPVPLYDQELMASFMALLELSIKRLGPIMRRMTRPLLLSIVGALLARIEPLEGFTAQFIIKISFSRNDITA